MFIRNFLVALCAMAFLPGAVMADEAAPTPAQTPAPAQTPVANQPGLVGGTSATTGQPSRDIARRRHKRRKHRRHRRH